MAFTLWVIVVDTETDQPVDLYVAEIKPMDSLGQAQLAAKIMAGII